MSGVNKVILLGRLGKDPDSRTTPGGQQVCNFSIATSESYVKDGKKEEKTEWHDIVLWGKLAELAGKYLNKGDNVYVEGKIQTRSWEKDGQVIHKKEVVASSMTFVETQKKQQSASQHPNYAGDVLF